MIQVREYARLTTDTSAMPSLDCGIVTAPTLSWLQDLTEGWKGAKPVALMGGHRSIKLGSYVGFLQSPTGEAIEILPKTNLGAEEPQATRRLLQRMLSSVMGVSPRAAGAAELMRMRQPLHEWILAQFLTELQLLLSRGLRFDYQRVEEESRFIRGQLKVDKQQRQAPGRQHLFPIRHDIYTPDRLENRLLKTALNFVLAVSKSNDNWRLANELAHRLADIPEEREPVRALAKWRSSKLLLAYEAVRPWCALILERLNPNFQQGKHSGIALLFPMEQLFEKYVEVCLRNEMADPRKLKPQASSAYLLTHTPMGSNIPTSMFQMKPDLLLKDPCGNQVLDTKWKLLDQVAWQSDNKYGISQADLYQLFAYGHKYQNGNGHMMLIYPKHVHFTKELPRFHYADELVLWAVPFCLRESRLVAGEWENYFPALVPQHTKSLQVN